jgi:NTP pyrophosphatase (non-canonical NTP hydrolase)
LNDEETNIAHLREIMQNFVDERKWNKYHKHPKELAIAISVEAAELLEIFLFQNTNPNKEEIDNQTYNSMKDEIADIFAYLLSIVNALDIDLTSVFLDKMKKNELKYPASKFSGNYKKV